MKIIITLDKILDSKNISQQQFSRMTGIRYPTINDMYLNKSKFIPLKNLAKICEVLECEISDILFLDKS